MHIPHMANMDKPREKDNGQRRTVVLQESSNDSKEQSAIAEFSANIATHENEERDHDAQVGCRLPAKAPLPSEDLNPFLQVDEGNVEAENVARKAGDIGKTITSIGYSQEPVHNQRPSFSSEKEKQEKRVNQKSQAVLSSNSTK